MNTPKLKLIGWRALIQVDQLKPEGIELPENFQNKDKTRGVVVGLGDGRVGATDKILPFPVRVGDRVLLGPFGVTEYFEDNVEYRIVSAEDILGVVNA